LFLWNIVTPWWSWIVWIIPESFLF
jgi:hypothetical protein